MPAIPVAINRAAAFIAPQLNKEGATALSAFLKLGLRYGPGGKAWQREAALFLTRAEERVLFTGARRFLFWSGGTLFLAGALLDLARTLIAGSDERRTVMTRMEIIQAHLAKGGPRLTSLLGVAEQVCFIILDATGETVSDALAGALSTFDEPGLSTSLMATWFDRGNYRDLATPVKDFDQVDSVLEAPGFLIEPALVVDELAGAVTFPAGPRPSFGQRR